MVHILLHTHTHTHKRSSKSRFSGHPFTDIKEFMLLFLFFHFQFLPFSPTLRSLKLFINYHFSAIPNFNFNFFFNGQCSSLLPFQRAKPLDLSASIRFQKTESNPCEQIFHFSKIIIASVSHCDFCLFLWLFADNILLLLNP